MYHSQYLASYQKILDILRIRNDVIYNQDKIQLIETNSKMTAMMELADENLKVDILKVISMLMNLKKDLN